MHVNGYALALMVLIAIGAGFCWRHRWLPRLVSIGAAAFAVCAVAAFPEWRNALAGAFGSGPGMLALILLALFGFGSFVVDHLRHHHPVRSTLLGIVGGTALILAYAMRSELAKHGSKLGPKTSAAISQAATQIQTGQAAHAETSSTRMTVLLVAGFVLLAFGALLHKSHKKRTFRNASTSLALPAGSGSRALPAGSGGPGGGKSSKPGVFRRMFGG